MLEPNEYRYADYLRSLSQDALEREVASQRRAERVACEALKERAQHDVEGRKDLRERFERTNRDHRRNRCEAQAE